MKAVDLPVEEILGNPHRISLPQCGTPKFDGIRCETLPDPFEVHPCNPFSSSLKPIPNLHIFEKMCSLPPYLDGELMSGKTFHNCESAVMAHYGTPDFTYNVFDGIPTDMLDRSKASYEERFNRVLELHDNGKFPNWVIPVVYRTLHTLQEIKDYVTEMIDLGYEGAVFRPPWSPYKYGRSTMREGWMFKVKIFVDDEAEVVGVEELLRNNNPARRNSLGYKERTSHAAAFSKGGTMGALVLQQGDDPTFKVGTGFNMQQRDALWADRDKLIGKICKFKYQLQGTKDKPRIPVFLGFRDISDL